MTARSLRPFPSWDITGRRQTDTELRLYARAFANSGEAILLTDRNNHIVAVNPAFTELTAQPR